MTDTKKTMKYFAMALVASVLLAGCGGSEGDSSVGPMTRSGQRIDPALLEKPVLSNVPGLPVAQMPDAATVFKAEAVTVASRYGGPRTDPFALKPSERTFEISQDAERVIGDMGSWASPMFEPPVEKDPNEGLINEPQPYRRLSGIIVGDSVYAILDMGDGSPVIIRPGMRIPNSEWTVVSIDEEKAVLRRSGNRLPRQVVVRLESPPGGVPNQGGGMPGAGAPGGGDPGLGDPGLGAPGTPGGGPGVPGGAGPGLPGGRGG